MCYHHVINDDTEETILTTENPIIAAERAVREAMAGVNVRYELPCTVQDGDRYYYPGQLISIEERAA